MDDGTGDQFLGAPNLTDAIWLYGGSEEAIEYTVRNARFGVMPPWSADASDADVFPRQRSGRSPSTSTVWVAASRPRPQWFRRPLPVAGPAPVPVLFARFLRDRCLTMAARLFVEVGRFLVPDQLSQPITWAPPLIYVKE
jgi:hypothetical protein